MIDSQEPSRWQHSGASPRMTSPILNVFMYHRVLPAPSPDGVSEARFRQQLLYLREHYEVLDAARLADFLDGRGSFTGPCAAITFDDGWLDNWLVATPVLQELKVPAILAVVSGYVHAGPVRRDPGCGAAAMPCAEAFRVARENGDPTAFLSRDELKAMLDTGLWDLQAHGHSHTQTPYRVRPARPHGSAHHHHHHDDAGPSPEELAAALEWASDLACRRRTVDPEKLARLLRPACACCQGAPAAAAGQVMWLTETPERFAARVREDLSACRGLLADLTGRPPEMLFWPWGHYSSEAQAIAAECGFRFTFSVEKGLVRPGAATGVLPRLGVSENWAKFRRNAWVFRHPLAARLHRLVSPSPSGRRVNRG